MFVKQKYSKKYESHSKREMFHATRAFAQVSTRIMTKITTVTKSLATDIPSIVVQNFVNLPKFPFFVSKSSAEKYIN